MKNNISLSIDLLRNLPNLKVLVDKNLYSYTTQSFEFGEVTFVNIKDNRDEWVIPIKNFNKSSLSTGTIQNLKEYRNELREACLEQEVIDYQTDKRISNYNW